MTSQQALAEIQNIVNKSNAMHQQLDTQRNEKEPQIQAIEAAKPPPLPAADLDQIDRLNAAIDALSALDDIVSIDTIQALEDSDAARSMAADIKSANANLKTALDQVSKTAQQIQNAAKFIQQVDGIVQNLIKLSSPPRGRNRRPFRAG